MKNKFLLLAVFVGGLALAGCASDETKPEDAAPADQAKPAETAGADQGAVTGTVQGGDQPGAAGDAGGAAAGSPQDRVVHFAFDSDSVDAQNRAIVEANANYLNSNPSARVTLAGHTDERGTREYNLALGERRAKSVERMLRLLGVPADRMSTTSFGEEKPLESGQSDSAWAQNRRVEFQYR